MHSVALVKVYEKVRYYDDDYRILADFLLSASDYFEVDDAEYRKIKELIQYQPASNDRYVLFEKTDLHNFYIDHKEAIDELENRARLEKERLEKNRKREEERKAKAEFTLLERKRKQLEKLKKELGQ